MLSPPLAAKSIDFSSIPPYTYKWEKDKLRSLVLSRQTPFSQPPP
jgi:hypothetical protein